MEKTLAELSPARLFEDICVKRYQVFLDTGYYPDGLHSKTWDMLAWLKAQPFDA